MLTKQHQFAGAILIGADIPVRAKKWNHQE
jgi:hypothetical protein